MQPHDPNIDARLRAVPLPEGLVERLRKTALADDDGLDAVLRDVPIPARMQETLRAIPLAEDEDIDDILRNVAIPADSKKPCGRSRWATTRDWTPLCATCRCRSAWRLRGGGDCGGGNNSFG